MKRALALALVLALAAPAGAAPRIEHWRTEAGTAAYFIAAPQIPMLDVHVLLDAGSARDGELPGLAQLSVGLLADGAGEWDAAAVARRFEDVGAQYGSEVQPDRAAVTLRTLTEPAAWREQALAAFVRVLSEPSFPEAELERRRAQMQTALRKLEEDPGAVAQRAFHAAVYPGHPYGAPAAGTAESLAAIDRGDVAAFHRAHFAAGGAVIALVGAVDRAEAERIAERIAAALPAGAAPPALPAPPPIPAARTIRIPHPSTQAHVLIGQQGVARGAPDHFPLYLGNYSLGGGGFSSRLMQDLRGEQGLAYSVYSYFFPLRHPGPFRLGFQTRGGQVEKALAAARAQLDRFVADGPTAAELEHARRSMTLGFPLRIASNGSMIGYLAMIGYYGLPLDYLDTWTERIAAIGRERIADAFRRTLDPARRITVIVGGQDHR